MPVERPLTPTAIDMADPDHLPMPVQSASRTSRSTPKLPKFSHRRAGASSSAAAAAAGAAASSRTHNSAKKSARISDPASRSRPEGLRVHWARFKRHLGTGTAPSSSSAVGDESTVGSSFHLARPRAGNGTDGGDLDEKQDLDEVVVDRDWMHEIKSSVVSPSERGLNDPIAGPHTGGTQTDQNSTVFQTAWSIITPWIILRYRFWPALCEFFAPKFYDEKSENHFKKENWFMSKSLAMWSSVFFIINWVLATAFVPRPYMLSDKIFYGGIAPVLTFPIFFFVIYDFPRDRPLLYQSLVIISVYSWSIYQLFFIFLCGYYNGHSHFQCGSRDFIGIFYYTTGLPTIALFGLKLNRFPAVLGACVFFGLACGLVLNDRTAWYRNLLNFVIYQVFIIYVHYMRENAERRLYTLRDMLKIQFRATQKAQVNERRAADSKRRLTSSVLFFVS